MLLAGIDQPYRLFLFWRGPISEAMNILNAEQ
jgi:hypothetical protein